VSLADLSRFEMARPSSLAEACALLASRSAAGAKTVLLAGGTDFMVMEKLTPLRPLDEPLPLVLDISRLAELRGVRAVDAVVSVGAACTFAEIQRDPLVRERLPLLARAAEDLGGPSIQARATVGGNLATASPAADGVAALGAYDAVVVVQSSRGERRIPMAQLQTGYKQSSRAPDEIIVAFEISPPGPEATWYWRKVGPRRAQAISKVAVAAVAELRDGTAQRFGLAAAAVAPVTALMPETRALVRGTELAALRTESVDRAVDADIAPIDDLRSTRAYRAHCTRALVREFLRQLGAPL